MIVGIGNDVVEIERIRQALVRHGEHFLKRVLSEDECRQAREFSPKRRAEFVAGRFAAKEALAKAVGCGLGKLVMSSVTIRVEDRGLRMRWTEESGLAAVGERDGLHVTISHSNDVAFAVAVWEKQRGIDLPR